MKVVILDGSHNKDGMTLKLVSKFIEGVKLVHSDAQIITHDLFNENISFCKGCGKCTEDKDPVNAKCVIVDDCENIKQTALNCDVLVFATPIYEYCVSSVMKRFLERCLTMVTFKMGPAPRSSAIKGKIGIIICSSGAPFPLNHLMGITRYPKFMLRLACKLFRCGEVEMVFAGGMAINAKINGRWLMKAERLGKEVAGKF